MTGEERILGIRDKRAVHLVERLIEQRDLDPGQMREKRKRKKKKRKRERGYDGGTPSVRNETRERERERDQER